MLPLYPDIPANPGQFADLAVCLATKAMQEQMESFFQVTIEENTENNIKIKKTYFDGQEMIWTIEESETPGQAQVTQTVMIDKNFMQVGFGDFSHIAGIVQTQKSNGYEEVRLLHRWETADIIAASDKRKSPDPQQPGMRNLSYP